MGSRVMIGLTERQTETTGYIYKYNFSKISLLFQSSKAEP